MRKWTSFDGIVGSLGDRDIGRRARAGNPGFARAGISGLAISAIAFVTMGFATVFSGAVVAQVQIETGPGPHQLSCKTDPTVRMEISLTSEDPPATVQLSTECWCIDTEEEMNNQLAKIRESVAAFQKEGARDKKVGRFTRDGAILDTANQGPAVNAAIFTGKGMQTKVVLDPPKPEGVDRKTVYCVSASAVIKWIRSSLPPQ